jgi:hypothetical protein
VEHERFARLFFRAKAGGVQEDFLPISISRKF